MKEYKATVSISLPVDVLEEIDLIAQNDKTTRSTVVERIIMKGLQIKKSA
jgi:metal-responsive CopG/Arc/MetJ family transcriptional regulator